MWSDNFFLIKQKEIFNKGKNMEFIDQKIRIKTLLSILELSYKTSYCQVCIMLI